MPIYEYKCENGHVFDVMQSIFDDSLTECIECNAPVRKVLRPVGISFKGSGFYSTDYKSGTKTETPDNVAAKGDKPGTNGSSAGSAAEKKPEKTSTEPSKQ